jgi:hypothetical protein
LSKACRAAILLSARTAHEGENIATAFESIKQQITAQIRIGK